MLLENYELEIFNSNAIPAPCPFTVLRTYPGCIRCLPYLNTLLGGFEYLRTRRPSLSRSRQAHHGSRPQDAVNALKDETEARKIIEWLKREINDAWDRRIRSSPARSQPPAQAL